MLGRSLIKHILLDIAILSPLASGIVCQASSQPDRVLADDAPLEKDESIDFKIGDVVEVYDPSLKIEFSSYAFAAQIKDMQFQDGEEEERVVSSYDVLPGIGLETLSLIPPSAIRPLRPFEYGTSAVCDFGSLHSTEGGMEYRGNTIPCTVLALAPDSNKGGNGGWYSVRYEEKGTEDVKFSMRSRSKILRIVHQENADAEEDVEGKDPHEETSDEISDRKEPQVDEEAEPEVPEFQVGDLVEIYDPTHRSPIVFPATVTARIQDPKSTPTHISYKYDLLNGITKAKMQFIDRSMIHSLKPQEVGSKSSCNVASATSSPESRPIFMVPCTIEGYDEGRQQYVATLHPQNNATPSLRNGNVVSRQEQEKEGESGARIFISLLSVQRTIAVEEDENER
mmetsp:Transcript_23023/g.46847  ORF Transcript_23023/g.46847 Transcript_23023/m.46847 type:complete len:396 (-) Transcript_23023:501-1688(-)